MNSWQLLSKQFKLNQYVTGRVGRSLKTSGLCVWLAGATSFLPYREYTKRQKIMPEFEGQLKTFQIASLNPSNLNCVVTRDKAIQSIIYRVSKSPEGTSFLSKSEKSASLNLGPDPYKGKTQGGFGKKNNKRIGKKYGKITFQPQS